MILGFLRRSGADNGCDLGVGIDPGLHLDLLDRLAFLYGHRSPSAVKVSAVSDL